jgi:glycosyltransferase involved in cell wall biosynthesis
MSKLYAYRLTVPALPQGTKRPLWSVMIPTYNCTRFLRDALVSVLSQDPGPEVMQIEVVDDYSTQDDPAAIVEEVGRGRVQFYRQPHNVGHSRNFDTCLQRSRGELVHLLHCDDYVHPGFYQKMQQAFEAQPEIGAAFCRHIHMHGDWPYTSRLEQPESGILANWLERISSGQRIQPPAMVVRRSVYEQLGGFDHRITYCGEDWEMWVRIAAQYPVWYEVEPLAVYRVHAGSLTGRSMRSGKHIQDSRLAIQIYQAYLPQERAPKLAKMAREFSALWALKIARQMLERDDTWGAAIQIREALSSRISPRVIRQTVDLLRWVTRDRIRRYVS